MIQRSQMLCHSMGCEFVPHPSVDCGLRIADCGLNNGSGRKNGEIIRAASASASDTPSDGYGRHKPATDLRTSHRFTCNKALIVLACLVTALLAGCATQQPSTPREMDEYWFCQPRHWDEAQSPKLEIAGKRVPTRFVFHHESTASSQPGRQGQEVQTLSGGELDVTLTRQRAAELSAAMNRGVNAARKLQMMERSFTPAAGQSWARVTAEAMTAIEGMLRQASLPPQADLPSTTRPAAPPSLLGLGAEYLSRRLAGTLNGELGPHGAARLRGIIARVFVNISFASVGRQEPLDLPEKVAEIMAGSANDQAMTSDLEAVIAPALAHAPPIELNEQQIRTMLDTLLNGAATMMTIVRDFLDQWDAIDAMTFEIRTFQGKPVIAITMDVRPGRQVRLAEFSFIQPTVTFRGRARVLFQPRQPAANDMDMLFESPNGDVHIEFEGFVYGLARLLVMPLDSGTLQEIRMSALTDHAGSKTIDIAVLMLADGAQNDARRILAVRYQHQTRLDRTEFHIDTKDVAKAFRLIYVTPEKMYILQRQMTIKE